MKKKTGHFASATALGLFWGSIGGLSMAVTPGAQAAAPCIEANCPSNWAGISGAQRTRIEDFAAAYKTFMNRARTETATIKRVVALAEAQGFKPWRDGAPLTPGARYYNVNRDRAMMLFVVGGVPLAEGARITASHIDSPHIELKGRPLYEREGFALFQTNYHGGILNYQWGNIPLALLGHIDKKDGSRVEIELGLKPDDPVFVIAGLAPHVDVDLRGRKNRDVLEGEELDPLIGNMPQDEKQGPAAWVKAYLAREYGAGLDDLVSAELAFVPAFAPRDVGFDRSMMGVYGQDDRLSAFASVKALFDIGTPKQTAIVYLANNEEVGDRNNTGAVSTYLNDTLSALIYQQQGEAYREPMLKRALRRSRVLSSDVNDGLNPQWPGAWEKSNAPQMGHGVNIKIYGHGNNAPSEYTAWLRAAFDDAGVPWQTATYKVGKGGGGTMGGELSRYNMDVIDIGVPVLSIHTTYSVSSKIDLYSLYRANKAFFSHE